LPWRPMAFHMCYPDTSSHNLSHTQAFPPHTHTHTHTHTHPSTHSLPPPHPTSSCHPKYHRNYHTAPLRLVDGWHFLAILRFHGFQPSSEQQQGYVCANLTPLGTICASSHVSSVSQKIPHPPTPSQHRHPQNSTPFALHQTHTRTCRWVAVSLPLHPLSLLPIPRHCRSRGRPSPQPRACQRTPCKWTHALTGGRARHHHQHPALNRDRGKGGRGARGGGQMD
jgi:hypothetical protein